MGMELPLRGRHHGTAGKFVTAGGQGPSRKPTAVWPDGALGRARSGRVDMSGEGAVARGPAAGIAAESLWSEGCGHSAGFPHVADGGRGRARAGSGTAVAESQASGEADNALCETDIRCSERCTQRVRTPKHPPWTASRSALRNSTPNPSGPILPMLLRTSATCTSSLNA